MNIEAKAKSAMQTVVDHFKAKLKSFRTSRANPSVLDNVLVEVYGTSMKLKDVANVTTPEAQQILITPYDATNVNAISKAIENANLNLQPQIDKNVVRINVPPMDESQRRTIAKECKKESEEAKIAIRQIRKKYKDILKEEKEEDLQKNLEKTIQKYTDDFCATIEDLAKTKEKEILEI